MLGSAVMQNRIARSVLDSIAEESDRTIVEASSEGQSLVCQTTSDGSYPTTAGVVYVMTPQELDADDVEGATATFDGDATANIYAINLGTGVPSQGDYHIVSAVGGKWCFRFD